MSVSRRGFFGGVAAALGYIGFGPDGRLFAQSGAKSPAMDAYDMSAKLARNENNYGPPESVMKAMNNAWKYSNRYGYPDANITQEIAEHHGVPVDHILL